MQSSRIITLILVGVVVSILAVWLGIGVASDQTQTLVIVGASCVLLIGVALGHRIWMLFLFLFSMEVPVIRGLTTMEFGYMILVGFSILMFSMRKLNARLKFNEMDFWRLAVAAMILQVYFRNPVGLNILGSGSVGARPYFIAVCSLLAGTILSKLVVPANELKWSRWIAIGAAFFMFPLNTWRYGLGRGVDLSQVSTVTGLEGEGAGRDGKYDKMARIFSTILSSKISPLRASFHPLWVWLVLIVFAFAAMSGYRNSVAYVGIILLIGIAYHGGFVSLVISSLLGAFALGTLGLINLAYPLPGTVQRALSPFPGTWEERFVEAGENSTEWRVEMWEAALFTDDWIKNKILGDGLGLTREELNKMQDMAEGGTRADVRSGLTVQQESLMITGGYHSGPVQTIRTVGYVGLAILLLALIRMAVLAHHQIRRCWGTEWQSTILFFGIPIIAFPFFFTLIFGTFQDAIAFLFINSALIDLFRNNLPLPHYNKNSKAIYRPLSWRATVAETTSPKSV